MKLSQVKEQLNSLDVLRFELPDGTMVPEHFHVTEVGAITKDFIDCGSNIRHEKVVSFQIWEANDYDHQLAPQKLLSIISKTEKVLGLGDWEIEVEYQDVTIGKYGLDFNGQNFVLTSKSTACLASDSCGSSKELSTVSVKENNTCAPGGGCC